MDFLIIALVTSTVIGGLTIRRSWLRQRREQLRDQARLKVIETQMAGLRATLRIGMAEHIARRRMHQMHGHDPFANSTLHEEPEDWRR